VEVHPDQVATGSSPAAEGRHPADQPSDRPSLGRLVFIGIKAFAINLLLILGTHPLVPVAVLVPFGTGFVTGWHIAAQRWESVVIAFVMGLCMVLLGAIVAGSFIVFWAPVAGGLTSGTLLAMAAVMLGLTGHLVLFAGAGAMVGGHYAQREAVRPTGG
jgi:hypothetical protein